MVLLALLICAATFGQEPASAGGVPADMVYEQRGQLVSVDGFRLNLYCTGIGSTRETSLWEVRTKAPN
jgi:hypothetical protein